MIVNPLKDKAYEDGYGDGENGKDKSPPPVYSLYRKDYIEGYEDGLKQYNRKREEEGAKTNVQQ